MNASGLLDAGVDIAYQPIVQLASGSVIAYEALARPRHPRANGPLPYFAALERGGLRLIGERSALRAAIDGSVVRAPRTRLFVNASPTTLVHPDFDILEFVELIRGHGLSPDGLVIEVTESEAITDLDALASRTQDLRRLGVGLAVDDAGAGHSSFRVITRLRPSFIKIDRELVTDVDVDGARHAFIEAMVRFSRQIGSRLVAEGIETEGELVSLVGLGVDLGQGYFLGRPVVGELSTPSHEARRVIALAAQRLRLGAAQVAVGELARAGTEVDPACGVADAYRRFVSDPSLGLLVLTEPSGAHTRFVGQLTRRVLERLLASPEAWSRLGGRTVGDLADREPLTVSAGLDVVEAAGILGARHPQEVADDVVVTDPRGDLVGVVAVRDVLRTLAEVRRQGDLDVHPLSGLLGRGWFEGELSRRLDAGEAPTMLFVDLDGLRRINDLGGFAAGDEVIRALSRALAGVAAGIEDAAVAHVGADDFMLLVPPRRYEEVVTEVVRRVEAEVVPLARTVLGLDPGGPESEWLALSIGAADLDGEPPPGHRYLDWAQNLLSPLLQTAKGHPGHACMHRTGSSQTLSTWTSAGGDRVRTLAVGPADPAVVLEALDLVERMWSDVASGGTRFLSNGFAGGAQEVNRLLTEYAEPVRTSARSARERGAPVTDVVFQGEEDALLGLLDRVALVAQRAAGHGLPVPPELALLDRLARHRARELTRHDVVSPTDV